MTSYIGANLTNTTEQITPTAAAQTMSQSTPTGRMLDISGSSAAANSNANTREEEEEERKLHINSYKQPQNAQQQERQELIGDNVWVDSCICTCDRDSSISDEREKTDTTPENVDKKITDDVIDLNVSKRSSCYSTSIADEADSDQCRNSDATASQATKSSTDDDESNARCHLKESNNIRSKDLKTTILTDESGQNTDTMDCTMLVDNSSRSAAETPNDDVSTASNMTSTENTTSKQLSYAFTIDDFAENSADAAVKAAKYKNMLERFQNRHRRGVSLTKFEGDDDTSTANNTTSKMKTSTSANTLNSIKKPLASRELSIGEEDSTATPPKVKLRARDRSTSRVRDASKRHSWSPRSNTNADVQQQNEMLLKSKAASKVQAVTSAKNKYNATTCSKQVPAAMKSTKNSNNLMVNRTQFTPRSTAMQMALNKGEFIGQQPPLADLSICKLQDNVSETGTYTVHGDNYTEEEKHSMNIDKAQRDQQLKSQDNRPKNLHFSEPQEKRQTRLNNRSNNVLEVNYYHETVEADKVTTKPNRSTKILLNSDLPASAYMEKVKSRVLRSMTAKNAQSQNQLSPVESPEHTNQILDTETKDAGFFTSVTTSGVLAKQRALDPQPKITRRNSLSTSQIDSSEYVVNEGMLPNFPKYEGGISDTQKAAEYRLNVYKHQKDLQKFVTTRNFMESPPQTPVSTDSNITHTFNDAEILKTAHTKHDWVQEWARNARARSLANDSHTIADKYDSQDLMTRSYTYTPDTRYKEGDGCAESLTDDSFMFNKKLQNALIERCRGVGMEYASDNALYAKSNQGSNGCKPPRSPTKIPSPIHSIGRARSVSRPRASFLHDFEYYQELDPSLQGIHSPSTYKKSTPRSPSLSSGSRRVSNTKSRTQHAPAVSSLYTPDDRSPHHSLTSPTYRSTGVHYQNLSASHDPNSAAYVFRTPPDYQLMTSSINEQQLKALTSGIYLTQQNSPPNNRVGGKYITGVQTHATDMLLPLRRSSSFSTKVAGTQRSARPQFDNIYTPPPARHQKSQLNSKTLAPLEHGKIHSIAKSASSNNFQHIYSDYDDNLQYYINDEDDDDTGYSEQYQEDNFYEVDQDIIGDHAHASMAANVGDDVSNATIPVHSSANTRYTKAVLMRIEHNKQRAGGKVAAAPANKMTTSASGAGLVACPNTPELPRRKIKSAGVGAVRQSMPRDTSLSRLASQVPTSLALAKKQLLQTAAGVPSNAKKSNVINQRAQPKYLDISKYKSTQVKDFLRRGDDKFTPKTTVADVPSRGSPGNVNLGLSRNDPSRISNRSSKSVSSSINTSYGNATRASSAARRDASIAKQKEAEMAMWKRRSTYNPMKAAAEDRRKKEEAKSQPKCSDEYTERPSRSPYRRGYF